ncbi:tRNA (guanine(46)-N(7))-methyltransferase TrmB [Acidomonas methanolica]|uniref:tRNA (guanine-N(7)-)-methyltransferase n=2 Tax=Acidomonas methanolica TaxID=437 RepID=A0A023D5D6_ACIMT|nr:tRNA (guanine(46)-N(7))-methyltransferase TrmB [Acidomonas methanolica]MBU2653258.1 tRNA (guanine(46)-N(7))-methyltransferase TrmB [Acidomonas methanolica]TCS32207.1 tRNA (guanine-N7-)-methyltransferase [Acidomonas methanolica]GAJ29011.1 tRNA (guanine-N(7)-)-methyltransferase [Acidomonas methanolica NBRC 104435]GEK97641.1 tRNA (guanine-N(7)-)-methyltransferase [Acidomonas methanolica NBRC 104435]
MAPSTAETGVPPETGAPGTLKPQPERLYGRQRGHPLRARQQKLLTESLPRLRLQPEQAHDPRAAFSTPVEDVWLEIGFGGGEHALAQSAENPSVGYIAAEVFENGLCSLLTRLVPEGEEATVAPPSRLRLWPDDARLLLKALPDSSLGRVYLMFPDPWPKARHAKRRFVHPENIREVARVLRPGGVWRIASDHPTYQGWVTEVMAAQTLFAPAEPARGIRPPGWSPTRYEAKAVREGRTPFYWTFVKND